MIAMECLLLNGSILQGVFSRSDVGRPVASHEKIYHLGLVTFWLVSIRVCVKAIVISCQKKTNRLSGIKGSKFLFSSSTCVSASQIGFIISPWKFGGRFPLLPYLTGRGPGHNWNAAVSRILSQIIDRERVNSEHTFYLKSSFLSFWTNIRGRQYGHTRWLNTILGHVKLDCGRLQKRLAVYCWFSISRAIKFSNCLEQVHTVSKRNRTLVRRRFVNAHAGMISKLLGLIANPTVFVPDHDQLYSYFRSRQQDADDERSRP